MLAVLTDIPKELWTPLGTLLAGAFTATVAFIAVSLQNRSAERRHRAELEHDARQRHLERLAELRKLVYLDALEGMANLGDAYSQLWNPEVPEGDIKEQIAKSRGSISRLTAIANVETLKALDEANAHVTAVIPDAMSVRLAMATCKNGSEKIKRFFERAIEQHDEKVKLLKELPPDADIRGQLERERDELLEHAKKIARISLEDISSTAKLQAKVLMKGHEKLREYNRAVARATVAIRKELGFEFDEAALVQLLDASAEAAHQQLVSSFDKLVKEFSEYFEKQTI